MIEYMGRRCAVCRERMYYGFVLGPPDEDTKYDALSGVAIVGRAPNRSAYHPRCMPDEERRLLKIHNNTLAVARNARRRLRRAAQMLPGMEIDG